MANKLRNLQRAVTRLTRTLQPFFQHRLIRYLLLFWLVLLTLVGLDLGVFAPQTVAQVNPQLGLVTSFTPNSVPPGSNSTYELIFRNSSNANITITSLNHTLPNTAPSTGPGALIISGGVIFNDCGSTITLTPGTYPGTPGSYTITGGTIPFNPGGGVGQCTIRFPVRGFASGNHIDTIPASTLTTSAGTTGQPTSATLQVLNSSAATIAKASSPNTIPGDGRFSVTITITNPNSFPLAGAQLQDLMTGSPYQVDQRPGAPAPTTTCAGGTVAITAGAGGGVTLTGGTIPASGACTITYPATGTTSFSYNNTIPANALITDNLVTNNNSPSAPMNVQTQVTMAKAFSAGNIVEGNTRTLTITISNGGIALTGVSLTDPLPAPLLTAATPNASTTCTASGVSRTLTVAGGANSFTLNDANVVGDTTRVPPSNPATNAVGTCTVTVTVQADPGTNGNLTPSGQANYARTNTTGTLTSTQGITASPASANINVRSALVATKTYSNPLAPGSTTRVTIAIQNNSSVAAAGVTFTDNLPAPMAVATLPNATFTNCGVLGPSPAAGDTTLNFSTPGSITGGGTCTIQFDVTVPAGTPVGTNLDNVIPDNSITNTSGFDSNGVTGTEGRVTVVNRVTFAKAFNTGSNPSPARRGLPTQMTITIANNRRNTTTGVSEPLTGVAFTDTLPVNLIIATPNNLTSSGCNASSVPTITATAGSNSISVSNASLNPLSTCTIQVDVIEADTSFANFPTPSNYNNTTSTLTSTEEPPVAPATATLQVVSPLATNSTKSFQAGTIAAGGISTVTITLNNSQPSAITGITFTDTWGQLNTQIVQAPAPNALPPRTTCAGSPVLTVVNSRRLDISGITLNPQVGGTLYVCTIQFEVQMDATGPNTFVNTIPAGGITSDQGFTNPNAITATLNRTTVALSLNKSISPNGVVAGDPATLTVTLNNPAAGGVPLSNLTFTDTMPAGMVVFATPNPTTTCSGTITGTPGTNTFTLTGATLAPGGNCTITIQVTLNVSGNQTNTLPAGVINTKEGVTNGQPAAASLNALPSFQITKAFSPSVINTPPNISQLTITIRNLQTSAQLGGPISNISLFDTLPSPMVIASPTASSTTCPGGTVPLVGGESGTVQLMTGANLNAGQSCVVNVNVTVGPSGVYNNQIAPGQLQGQLQGTIGGGNVVNTNSSNTATLTINQTALPPNVLLVKRITGLNTTPLTALNNDAADPNDDNVNWPAAFLRGELTLNNVRPGDEIEYTVYFINVGQGPGQSVRVCDRILPNQTFIASTYNGQTPTDGGFGPDSGIRLAIGPTPGSGYTNNFVILSNANDPPDRGEFFPPPTVPPACNIAANDTGAVAVNVTRAAAPAFPQLPNAVGPGNPANSYGFIRFRTRVN